MDVSNEPEFPFGYGLSYSQFEYGEIELSSADLKAEDRLKVTIPVKNSSDRDGKEVVQLYIRDKVGTNYSPC